MFRLQLTKAQIEKSCATILLEVAEFQCPELAMEKDSSIAERLGQELTILEELEYKVGISTEVCSSDVDLNGVD